MLLVVSARQNAISSLQSTKLGHILQIQSPIPLFLSMIPSFKALVAFTTTYKISHLGKNGWGNNRLIKKRITFFNLTKPLGIYARKIPFDVLFGMRRPFDRFLYGCRVFFLPDPTGNCSTNHFYGRRKYHCHQEFRIRSFFIDGKKRYSSQVDKPGRSFSCNCVWYRFPGNLFFGFARIRCILFIYVHPTGNIYVSLLDTPVHERHNYCNILNFSFF